MVLALMKLHPTKRPLVRSPFTSSNSSQFGISKWKQLDNHQMQNIFGVASSTPPDVTVSRPQHNFAQTYVSYVD
jgi:hypothetical protein